MTRARVLALALAFASCTEDQLGEAPPPTFLPQEPVFILDAGAARDAGASVADARVSFPDAAVSSPDAAVSYPDAAVTSPDATPMPDECDGYPFFASTLLDERVGFGAETIGGDPSLIYRVTTLAGGGPGSLREALESSAHYWIVFDVEGVITHEEQVRIASYKTIDGRGRDITVEGTLRIEDAEHIIISDIKATNALEGHCEQAGDVIAATGTGGEDPESYTSKNIWLHHVELFDGGDGLFDIRGASKITVSWTHFHTHKKAILAWKTSGDDQHEATGMRVTFHHNFFDRITLRGPLFNYGWAHFLNNYQFEWYEHGAASINEAQFYSEANVYEARPGRVCLPSCPDMNPCGDNDFVVSKDGLVTFWTEDSGYGFAKSVGDLAVNDAEISENEPSRVFDPAAEYPYVADVADAVLMQRIRDEAGPRVNYCR